MRVNKVLFQFGTVVICVYVVHVNLLSVCSPFVVMGHTYTNKKKNKKKKK